jgi:hypothetical protein
MTANETVNASGLDNTFQQKNGDSFYYEQDASANKVG